MRIAQKLEALGLELPPTPKPLGAYVPAVREGNRIWVSGQLPLLAGKLVCRGRVGQDVTLEKGQEAARICFLNVLAAVRSTGVELEDIQQVVRLTGHVFCAMGFGDQPKVLNGASELCHELFGEKGVHSRVALGSFELPMNATVELEALLTVAL